MATIDSLKAYVKYIPNTKLSNTDLFIMTNNILYRPYKWNRSTLNEIKSSGGLSYITNDELQSNLVAYESFSNHLDEDFQYDKNLAEKAEEMISTVLNLNSGYFEEINAIKGNHSKKFLKQLFIRSRKPTILN